MIDVAGPKRTGLAALDPKQRAFVISYAGHGNATKAAIEAGYGEKGAHTRGYELVRNIAVREALTEALDSAGLTAAELDARLQGFVKTRMADLEPVIRGEATLAELEARGIDTGGVKSYRETPGKFGTIISVEIESPMAGIMALAKLRGLLVEKSETKVEHDFGGLDELRRHLRQFAERSRQLTLPPG